MVDYGKKNYLKRWDVEYFKIIFRAQSLISLMAHLRQDINRIFHLAGALMEHFLEGIAPLRLW